MIIELLLAIGIAFGIVLVIFVLVPPLFYFLGKLPGWNKIGDWCDRWQDRWMR